MATTVTLKPNAIDLSGSTSGTTTLQASAVAGTTTVTLPAATDTLVGKATTDTLTNKTLTSPVISGGTIDNASVGATTPSTGAFTTLSSTGNTTLGDATTDTVTVNGYMGVGGAATADRSINILGTSTTSNTTQEGVRAAFTANSTATTAVRGFTSVPTTQAATFTVTDVAGFWAANVSKGAGSTVTNQHGLYIANQTQGTNNYGITSLVSSGTNKWNIYASGTAQNYFAGDVGIGNSAPSGLLHVQSNLAGNNQIILTNIASSNSGAGSEIVFTQGASGYAAGKIQCDREGSYSATASSQDSALAFFTATDGVDAERMRVTSAGSVLIGKSTGNYTFEVLDAAGSSIVGKFNTAGTGAYLAFGDATSSSLGSAPRIGAIGDSVVTFTNGSEKMRVDSSGNVGIGTNTVLSGRLNVQVDATNNISLLTYRSAASTNSGYSAVSMWLNDSAATPVVYGALVPNITTNTAGAHSGSVSIYTTNAGTLAEKIRIDSTGNMQASVGAVMPYAPTPASIAAVATLTNANIQTQIINTTGTTFTLTMPLGTTLETLASWSAVNISYDFYVINTASGTITMAANTGVTTLGGLTIATGVSAHFRIRRTAANTFILYRLS